MAAFTLTVNGTEFVPGAVVAFPSTAERVLGPRCASCQLWFQGFSSSTGQTPSGMNSSCPQKAAREGEAETLNCVVG